MDLGSLTEEEEAISMAVLGFWERNIEIGIFYGGIEIWDLTLN